LWGAWATVAIVISFLLDDDLFVASLRGVLFWEFHMYCLEEGLLFT
jgi:hypothetical protein